MVNKELFDTCEKIPPDQCRSDDCPAEEACRVFQRRHGRLPSRKTKKEDPELYNDEEV